MPADSSLWMHLQITKVQEDADGLHQFWLRASNGDHSTTVDFYAYPEDLSKFGDGLREFSGGAGEEPTFECGSKAARAYSWVRLQVFCVDPLGHSALQVATNRNGARHVQASASFAAPFEVARLNELGRQLARWAASDARGFEFHALER